MGDAVKVGAKVWLWDENRRIYPKDKGVGCAPIWREHWKPQEVIGETSRSWLLKHGEKIPKKPDPIVARFIAWSSNEIDRREWVKNHGYQLAKVIDRCQDYDLLQKVAALVGYEG